MVRPAASFIVSESLDPDNRLPVKLRPVQVRQVGRSFTQHILPLVKNSVGHLPFASYIMAPGGVHGLWEGAPWATEDITMDTCRFV